MITYSSTTLTSYNSITSTEVYYYKSSSATALSEGSWSTTKPTWESGKYVWQKIRTIYEDETYTESDPVNITGQQGQTGDAAYSYKLNASDTAVTVSKTGEYSVNKITFTATYKQGTGAVTAYAGRFKIETTTNGTNWTAVYTSSGNESSKEYTIPTNIIAIRCSLYQAGGTSVLLDIITIPIVNDDRPLVTKTYTGLIGSANDAANASFYFAKIHPTSYTTNYKVKMKVRVTAPEAYAETIDIQFGGYGSTFSSYDSYTTRTGSVGVYYINLYRATQAGVTTNHKGHALGIGLRSSTNPTNTSYKRTVIIDILELDGCTIEMLDTAVKYANIDGTGSTNYYELTEMSVGTAGQNATNNTNTHYTQYSNNVKAGTNGIKGYSLIMKDSENTWSCFYSEAYKGTNTGKIAYTGGFALGKILYSSGAGAQTSDSSLDTYYNYKSGINTSTIYDAYPVDLRYSTNCGTTLVTQRPVYIVGTIENDGLFHLDVSQWWTQTEPTFKDNKVYIYLGVAYSTYQIWLSTENPAYTYYNGDFILYDRALTLQDIDSLKETLEGQIDGKVETWCQKSNPATNWSAEERPNHTGDLWYYIGESTSTYKNNTTYQYNGNTNTWTAYSANPDLFDKIDGKIDIYYGKPTITGAKEGDYLVDETDGSTYRYDASKNEWVKVTDYKTAIDNIEIGGRNILLNSATNFPITYGSSTLTTEKNVAISEFGCTDGIRCYGTGGTNKICALINKASHGLSVSSPVSINEQPYVFSIYVKNNHTTNVFGVSSNVPGDTRQTVQPGEAKRLIMYATGNGTNHIQFNMSTDIVGDNFDVTIWHPQIELGNKATDWSPAPEDTTASIQAYVDTLQFQVDHMAEIYYGTAVPTLSNTPASSWNTNDIKDIHVDDLYYNTSTGYCYRFTKSDSIYSWTRIKDSDITAAATAASNANTAAGNAQTTANNANTLAGQKRRIFVAQPTPPYEVGDLWVEGSNGDIKKCKTSRATGSYTASDWELASKYTDDTLANEANDKIDNLEIGGRNLLRRDPKYYSATSYGAYDLALTEPLEADQKYIIQLWDVDVSHTGKTADQLNVAVYYCGGTITFGRWQGTEYFTDGHADYLTFSFTPTSGDINHANVTSAVIKFIRLYNSVSSASGTMNMHVGKWKIEKGDKATDWSIAPEDMVRGTGFYSITTAPTSYTTATGGFTPAYRIALSTVKTESGLEEVMIGDVIQQGYNTYPVGYVDASYVYLGSANSIRGATGATGLNNAQVILYRRFASAPSGTDIAPTGDVTYTFATGKAINNLNSWTQNIPTGSNPVYMIAASASNTSATDVIPKTEWSAPVKILENGQNGGTGSAGADGYNQATIFLYQRKSGTAPSKPSSAVTYTFSTGTLSSTPTGWSRTIPANNGNPCYVTTATAVAKTATYSIPANGWSDVVILSQDGEDGTSITITGTSVKYQKGTSGTTAPTGTWGTSIPSVGENEFLWTQTIVNYSDSSKTESYSVSRNAKNGTNGTSPTVSSTTVEYQQSTGGTTPPTGTWTTSAPTATAGQYMWTRTTVKYSDNKTAVSYSVSKNGTNGTSPTAYHLIVSHGAINKSQAGVYNPTTITLTSKSQTGNGALNNYNGRFKIETTTDNSTWTQDSASSTADESSKTYTIPANIKAVRFSLYLAGGFTTLLDQQTVPIVIDGAKGDNGDDAYTIVLTNEAHTFPAGVSAALAGSATSSVMTYKGGIQVACFAGSTSSATSISTGTTGLTCAINNNNSKNVSLTFTATTSLTTRAGTVTIPITVDNKSFSKTFTWSLANQGAKGDNGVSVTNVTSTNNTADGGTSVVTITLSDGTTKTFNVKNGTKGNTGATAQWYYGTSLTHTSGTATLVATSTSGAVVGSMYLNTQTSLVYKCTAVGTNNTWTYAGDLTTGVIDNIEIGGRNLLLNSGEHVSTFYKMFAYPLSSMGQELQEGDIFTFSMKATIPSDRMRWAIYNSGGSVTIEDWQSITPDGTNAQIYTLTGQWRITKESSVADNTYLNLYIGTSESTSRTTVHWAKLERGNKSTSWTPAPEDTDASIQQVQTNLDNLEIGGRNLLKGTRTQDVSYGNYQNTVTITNDTFLDCTVFKSSIAWADIGFNLRTQIINKNLVKAGDILTYSVWAKTDDTENRDMYGIWVGSYIGGSKIGKITSEWQQYYKTFEITQAMIDGTDTIPTRFECNTACTSGKYIYWAAPKLERGSKATDWTPAPEDTQADIDTALAQSVEYIIGTQTAITGTWTGRTVDKELKVGKTIAYKLPYAGSGNASLVLTLADNTTTDAIAVYLNTTRVTTHFGAGSVINMTYDGYYWRITSIPNSDTVVNVIPYFSGKTGTLGIWRYSLFMRDGNGTYQNICTASDGTVTTTNSTIETTKKANPNGFEVGSSIWYANGAEYNANTNISGYNVIYSSTTVIDSRYSLNTERKANSLTPYLPIYLIGEIKSDNLFYLDTVWWTQTPTDSSKVYVLIGGCYDSTTSNVRIALYENNGWYKYVNGKLEDYSNRLAELASTTATAYITDTTDNGIMVHPENDTTSGWSIASAIQLFKSGISYIKLWIENNVAKIRIGREDERHVLIDNDSVDIKNGQNVLASFGENIQIGQFNDTNIKIQTDGLSLNSYNGKTLCKIGHVNSKTVTKTEELAYLWGNNVEQKKYWYHFPDNIVDGSEATFEIWRGNKTGEPTIFNITIGTGFSKFQNYINFWYTGYKSVSIDLSSTDDSIFLNVTYSIYALDTSAMIIGSLAENENDIGDKSISIGDGNQINHNYAGAIGTALKTGCNSQFLIGSNNKVNSSYAFAIGNGVYDTLVNEDEEEIITYNENNASNAFSVSWDGNIEIALNTTATTGTTDADLYDAITALSWENDVLT